MFRPVRVRVPKARLSVVTPYPLEAESARPNNQDEHKTPSTLSSITRLQAPSITDPEPLLGPPKSFLTRFMSRFNFNSKPAPSTIAEEASSPDLRKRDSLQSQNVTIGVVVGVFLAVFLIALFFFLYRYNASMRLKRKRKKRRRASRTGSGSSKGSTSSTTTQGLGPPEPAGA